MILPWPLEKASETKETSLFWAPGLPATIIRSWPNHFQMTYLAKLAAEVTKAPGRAAFALAILVVLIIVVMFKVTKWRGMLSACQERSAFTPKTPKKNSVDDGVANQNSADGETAAMDSVDGVRAEKDSTAPRAGPAKLRRPMIWEMSSACRRPPPRPASKRRMPLFVPLIGVGQCAR